MEPQDCVPGSALVVEVTEEAEVVVEVREEGEEEEEVVAAAALRVRVGGSFISQRERSSSIHRENWM